MFSFGGLSVSMWTMQGLQHVRGPWSASRCIYICGIVCEARARACKKWLTVRSHLSDSQTQFSLHTAYTLGNKHIASF